MQSDGWTALMAAAGNGHEEVVPLLLEAGADPEVRATSGDEKGLTALELARQQAEVVRRLEMGYAGVVRRLEVRGGRVGEGCLRAAYEL